MKTRSCARNATFWRAVATLTASTFLGAPIALTQKPLKLRPGVDDSAKVTDQPAQRSPETELKRRPGIDASQVAGSVQAFYRQTKGIRAKFDQSYYYKLYDKVDRSSGNVLFVKPGKMRWDYQKPNGKVIVSDRETLRIFEPGSAGEVPQLIEQSMKGRSIPEAFSFLTGEGQLEQSFTFRLLDASKYKYPTGYVLELRPLEPSPHYDRVLLFVMSEKNKPTGIVPRVLIVDASGNRNRFDFSSFEWNPSVSEKTFLFTPPKGTRVTRP